MLIALLLEFLTSHTLSALIRFVALLEAFIHLVSLLFRPLAEVYVVFILFI
jgi:hypothetical protein